MAVSINSFGAMLGKVAFGNAGVPQAVGMIGRTALRKEGGSMATTALGRLYRRGGVAGVASAFARRGAGGAMIGAGIGASVGVANQVSQNRSYGDGAMNGVFGAALRGGLAGGALGMALQGGLGFGSAKKGFSGALREGGFSRGMGPGLSSSFNWANQAGRTMTGIRSGRVGDAAFGERVAARAAARGDISASARMVRSVPPAPVARDTMFRFGTPRRITVPGRQGRALPAAAPSAFRGMRSAGFDSQGRNMKSWMVPNTGTRGSGSIPLSWS